MGTIEELAVESLKAENARLAADNERLRRLHANGVRQWAERDGLLEQCRAEVEKMRPAWEFVEAMDDPPACLDCRLYKLCRTRCGRGEYIPDDFCASVHEVWQLWQAKEKPDAGPSSLVSDSTRGYHRRPLVLGAEVITLTIPGRPVPAVRMTQRGKWADPAAQRYLGWKDFAANGPAAEPGPGLRREPS